MSDYLNKIGNKFKNDNERKEIIEDVEIRISELFNEKLNDYKQVITKTDVIYIIEIMGAPSSFSEEDNEEQEDKKKNSTKKTLYRDANNKEIAGVCSGIAHYFNIEVNIVRVIFGLSILLGGTGIIAYLVISAIIPEATNIQLKEVSRKIYRDKENKMIAGVCSGISQYFNIDTSVTRVTLALLFVLGGFGGVIYLILWVVIPEAKSTSEKLAMKGKKANLKNIEDFFNQFKSSQKKKASNNVSEKHEIVSYEKSKNINWLNKLISLIQKTLSSTLGITLVIIGLLLFIPAIISIFDIDNVMIINTNNSILDTSILSYYISDYFWLIYSFVALLSSIGLGFVILGLGIYYYKNKKTRRRLKPLKHINTILFASAIISLILTIKYNHLGYIRTEKTHNEYIDYKNIIIRGYNPSFKTISIFKDNITKPTIESYNLVYGFKSKKTSLPEIKKSFTVNDSIISFSQFSSEKLAPGQFKETKIKLILPDNDKYKVTYE